MMRRGSWIFALALLALFAFRLYFGLSLRFFAEDESQIFLIGLRYYTTGHWPYFGPDVVWTESEIPGALQGLLVGAPLDDRRGSRGADRRPEPAVLRGARGAGLVHLAPCAVRSAAGWSGAGR